MPRLQKDFKKRKGKYYPRKNTINSKVSTTDCNLNAQAEHAHDSKQSCAKEKKIPDLNENFSSFGDSVGILNAIMNLNILAFVFKNEVHCKMCNSGLDMQFLKGKSGLAIAFVLECFACPYRVEFSSSNFHEGTQIATINTRFVYAMRSIEKVQKQENVLRRNESSANHLQGFLPFGNKNIAVAVDGTWQKRGYTSLNGVVTVTSIDTVILWISYSEKSQQCSEYAASYLGHFLHKLSTDEYPQHGFCPIGKIHSVDLKKAEASGKSYKHKNSLTVAVVEAMRPIFRDLSHPDLLKKSVCMEKQKPE
ncbi:uncharacterized protein TNCV_2537541 [Trichonephila clavipes]|nr:uncharacterized protein TNCV_2537541 [Trichonephila clavipes]